VIYAGVNGYLDVLPVERVRSFEDGLLGLLRNQHSDLLAAIRDSRDLDDTAAGKLKTIVDNYARTFA
jgi:F-type H+/Na+-transporting ATPase subunit alpha